MTSVEPTPAAQGAAHAERHAASGQRSGQGAFEGVHFERFDDVMIGPPRVTTPQHPLLVLSDDEAQRDVIRQCAPGLECTPVFLTDGMLLINAILKPATRTDGDVAPDVKSEIPDLIVVGGSTPGWVQMQMAMRLVTACKAHHRKPPAFLFLLTPGDVPSFESVLDVDHVDFLQCPINAAEFKLRMTRLSSLRRSKSGAVAAANKGDVLNDPGSQEAPPTLQPLLAQDARSTGQPGQPTAVDSQAVRAWGPYAFDVRHQQVTIRGEVKYLPLREFNIAWILFTHMDQTVTYDELISNAFTRTRADEKDQSRLLGSYVSRLRTHLGLTGQGRYKLLAIYRVGYMLKSTD